MILRSLGVFFLCVSTVFANPFYLGVEVAPLESINRLGRFSPDFKGDGHLDTSDDPSFGGGSLISSPEEVEEGVPAPPVRKDRSVRLGFGLPVELGDKPEGSSSSVRFVSRADRSSIRQVLPPKLVVSSERTAEVLPPPSEGGVLPPADGALPSRSVLLTRDGKMIEGMSAMMDYLLDQAVPAQAVSEDPRPEEFLKTLGSPTGEPVARRSRVEADGLGVLDMGLSLGAAGEATIAPGSGFFPEPPVGYEGSGIAESRSQVVSGHLW